MLFRSAKLFYLELFLSWLQGARGKSLHQARALLNWEFCWASSSAQTGEVFLCPSILVGKPVCLELGVWQYRPSK